MLLVTVWWRSWRWKCQCGWFTSTSCWFFKDDLLENQPAVDSGSPSLSNGDLDQLETMMDRLDMMHVSDSANLCSSLHSTLCKNQLNLKIS